MDIELKNNLRKRGKHIQIFSDGCKVCQNHIDNVEIGKCAGCNLEIHTYELENQSASNLIRRYNIKVHPTTIIDDEIKVEGEPAFYWQCGDKFYKNLKTEYPID